MLTLHELQKKFVNALDNNSEEIFCYIRPAKHLDVYQDSVLGALQKILKEIYPVCLKLVGEEFFIAMINEYIPTSYSSSPDLGDYGTTFPHFIANFSPVQMLPYLSDIAKLELACHQLFSAKESSAFDYDELAACYKTHGENIQFQTPHNSSLIYSPYPIHHIWESNQDNNETEQTINLQHDKHHYFFIWREKSIIHFDLLSEMEWRILSWIKQEWSLARIADKIEKLAVVSLPELLSTLVTKQWIIGFSIAKNS